MNRIEFGDCRETMRREWVQFSGEKLRGKSSLDERLIFEAGWMSASKESIAVMKWLLERLHSDDCDDIGKLLDDLDDKARATIATLEGGGA